MPSGSANSIWNDDSGLISGFTCITDRGRLGSTAGSRSSGRWAALPVLGRDDVYGRDRRNDLPPRGDADTALRRLVNSTDRIKSRDPGRVGCWPPPIAGSTGGADNVAGLPSGKAAGDGLGRLRGLLNLCPDPEREACAGQPALCCLALLACSLLITEAPQVRWRWSVVAFTIA